MKVDALELDVCSRFISNTTSFFINSLQITKFTLYNISAKKITLIVKPAALCPKSRFTSQHHTYGSKHKLDGGHSCQTRGCETRGSDTTLPFDGFT